MLGKVVVALPPVNTVPVKLTEAVEAAPAPLKFPCPVAPREVKSPLEAVVPPMAPGAAKVAPPRLEALRLATFVVLATLKGDVPVASVDTICSAVLTVVPLSVILEFVGAPPAPPPFTRMFVFKIALEDSCVVELK